MHIRNFTSGKTTNERFSKKATNSFSELASGTYAESDAEGMSETESLIGDGSSRAGSIVADEQ